MLSGYMLKIFTILIACLIHVLHVSAQEVTVTAVAVTCNGGNDGVLTITLPDNKSECTLRLMESKNNRLLKSIENKTNTIVHFPNLKAGEYIVQLISDEKSEDYQITVEEPEKLSANAIFIEQYPSSKETCDGIIQVQPTGGTPPYSFHWIEGAEDQETARLTNLCENIYTCEVQDANKCGKVKATAYLFEGFKKDEKIQ